MALRLSPTCYLSSLDGSSLACLFRLAEGLQVDSQLLTFLV
jgi:hypothetical protein